MNSKQTFFFKIIVLFLSMMMALTISGCGEDTTSEDKPNVKEEKETATDERDVKKDASLAKLPDNIEWLTNDSDPVFASPHAKKGGTFRDWIQSFPMTFRTVGPDSNGSFRSHISANQLSLIELHPNAETIIPSLATHWAFDDDKKTMYFKLNKNARWSDGAPVTAGDFKYAIDFFRSKHIAAPYSNHYFTTEIDKVIVYDDHTLAVVSTKEDPDLFLRVNLRPVPKHFYGELNENFVKKYNWKIAPNTGPYQISDFAKGKKVVFKRKKDWWAKDLRYYKNRFNVDKVIFKVIRDSHVAWEHFKKNKVDRFRITFPSYWYEKTKANEFNNGYIHKMCFFNDSRRPPQGLFLNTDKDIFKDVNVRRAFAHSINIEKVIQKVLRNDYFRLNHAYEGYGRYSNDAIRARKFDVEKVAGYMKESGWERGADGIWVKNGKRFSVELTYSSDVLTPRYTVVKEEAKKAGVEILLEKLDGSTSFKKILEKNHEVAMMAWSTSFRPRYWQGYHSDNAHKTQTNNITNADDPALDKLVDKYHNSTDAEERIRLSIEIQQMLHDLCYFIPTMKVPYFREAYWRWWKHPDVAGTKHSDVELFNPFDESMFWYDEDLHKETLEAMKNKKTFPPVTIIDETFKTY